MPANTGVPPSRSSLATPGVALFVAVRLTYMFDTAAGRSGPAPGSGRRPHPSDRVVYRVSTAAARARMPRENSAKLRSDAGSCTGEVGSADDVTKQAAS
jgi:hypothetical protein